MSSPGDVAAIGAHQSSALRNHDRWALGRHKAGLGPESQDSMGNGPLHLACHPASGTHISLDFFKEVLSWAPTLDRSNALGWTPLGLAVLFLSADAVRLLVELGRAEFPRSIQDALRLAANYERSDITAVLLRFGKICEEVQPSNDRLAFSLRVDRHAQHLLDLQGLVGRYPHLDRQVAEIEQTDERVLRILATSYDRPTLREVARNPNTPTETLLSLAPKFPRPFFSNPVFDWLLLENPDRILEMGGGVIRGILRVKDCPTSMIEWAVEHGSDSERLAVIRRGDVAVETLRVIASKSNGRVRSLAVANDPDALPSMLSTVAGIDVEADRLIAGHSNSEPDLLEKLGNSADSSVRAALLKNPKTPAATKLKIASGGLVVHVLRRR